MNKKPFKQQQKYCLSSVFKNRKCWPVLKQAIDWSVLPVAIQQIRKGYYD